MFVCDLLRIVACVATLWSASRAHSEEFYAIDDAPPQPLIAQARRIALALEFAGSPLRAEDTARLAALDRANHDADLARAVQAVLDPYCLALVHIDTEAEVRAMRGPAEPWLTQGGWRSFLVKVHNESGTRGTLHPASPQAEPSAIASSGEPHPDPEHYLSARDVTDRFLELQVFRRPPMTETLLGGAVEYQLLLAYTNVTGPRETELSFEIDDGTEELRRSDTVTYVFDCRPSARLVFDVRDEDGKPAMASFVVRDRVDRRGSDDTNVRSEAPLWAPDPRSTRFRGIYPLPVRRVALTDEYPDFFFQRQVYRTTGEHVILPPGTYDIFATRGPEYVPQIQTVEVPRGVEELRAQFDLKRWTHLAALGWYSGDHHVHAGGCSHYESPEAGVTPESMFRQALGEDLNVACVLTWGPCWYHQKSFFEGQEHRLSTPTNLLRYDVEVSGFPSSHAGHVCLLRLKEDDYPGTTHIEDWPSWTLPVMQWARSQGGVAGYAHSGSGLEPQTPTDGLPNYVIPKFDGVGANEYIVTVAHGACDFISMVDTPAPWELNIWYHTLNSGMRARISGETDFPCIYDERVGMGRSYAKLDTLSFDAFVQSIKDGANYVSDGMSHIIDFRVDSATPGVDESELLIDGPRSVRITARVAAYLAEKRGEDGAYIGRQKATERPFWHIERARIAQSRNVKLELVVNGHAVDSQIIKADGEWNDVSFRRDITFSSWIALRVYQSSHTNPVFVLVDGAPVRASRRSALWCAQAVDRCWHMKKDAIRPEERAAAEAAYTEAKHIYFRALAEAVSN